MRVFSSGVQAVAEEGRAGGVGMRCMLRNAGALGGPRQGWSRLVGPLPRLLLQPLSLRPTHPTYTHTFTPGHGVLHPAPPQSSCHPQPPSPAPWAQAAVSPGSRQRLLVCSWTVGGAMTVTLPWLLQHKRALDPTYTPVFRGGV